MRARLERALAALDARGSDDIYAGDLMALRRGLLCSALEDDTRLFRCWSRSSASPVQPFVEVIPPRQAIESGCPGQSAPPAPLDAPGEGSSLEQLLSRAELARAHQQFLDSLPPCERALFGVRPRAERH